MLNFKKTGIIGRTYRTYRHLNRYRQIIAILFKYGFGDVLEMLKIDQFIEKTVQIVSKKRRDKVEKFSRPERLRMAIEELGVTFIKLGQILSTRPDLIPVEYTFELVKLQDEVPPFPFTEASRVIEKELGAVPEEIFPFFEETPIASASIGQVHKARLRSGEYVAVKVQRPGIWKTISVDLEIMLHLAELVERNIEELALHHPIKIVEEFSRALEREIDYSIEATNQERIAHQFKDDPTIFVPRIYKDLSTDHVITMEFVDGIKISEISRLDKAGYDRKIIVKRGVQIVLKQVFKYGFFHADPHPGNIFILPGNVICLLDFGMVGSVDRQTREDFVDLIDSLVQQDETKVTMALLKLTTRDVEPELRALEKDIADLMGQHLYKPLKEIESDKLLKQLLQLAARHKLRTRPDIFLMARASSAIEGVARILDPDVDVIALAAPYIAQVKLAKFTPQRVGKDLLKFSSEALEFLEALPNNGMDIIRLLKDEKISLNLKIEIKDLNVIQTIVDQASNRIFFAIIILSLILGSAIIVFAKIPPFIFGISVIGICGFSAAAFIGFWVIVMMLRKNKL
ncbi:MAG: AarF/ABC1/UbiB kinase family protein [Desulfobacterales bacterium]|nr:AarF/ABC1/UbiB kinase family protein [Desulfobacterales bacterium]MBF0395506.1 AarF/ABC1/UbiB kinase family protein [Desulfobacterales bacterium]